MISNFDRRSGVPSRTQWIKRIAAALCILALTSSAVGCASDPPAAVEEEDRTGKIEPRYQPREPLEEPFYDTRYLFAMTRGVTDSTIHPAGQIPLLLMTIPLDIVVLPFAAIGGFF